MRLFRRLDRTVKRGGCHQRIYFYVCVFVLALPNLALFFTEDVSIGVKICNLLLPVSFFWLMMTLSEKPGKMLWIMFLFVFLGAFESVLLYMFGESVIAVDMFLNLVTTNQGEVSELLGNIMAPIVFVVVTYGGALCYGVLSMLHPGLENKFLTRNRKFAVLLFGIGLLVYVLTGISDEKFKIVEDIYPVNVLNNARLAIERDYKTRHYQATSRDFTFRAVALDSCTSKEVYILVIGESARADNFGLAGYRRNTTPLLSKMKNSVFFRNAYTQSNTTHKSVPMLMSDITAADYDNIYGRKSIITAYKEAGFHTAFFSNQMPNHSFIDFFGCEADDVVFVREHLKDEQVVPDERLLDLVKAEMSKPNRQRRFIVLHMYGSHFNYTERYERSEAFYKPDVIVSADAQNRDVLINAYDNTIRNTDRFLAELMALLSSEKIVGAIVYTSDHGEDIYDDARNLFLHASPIPSYYQLHVPLLVWGTDDYLLKYPKKMRAVEANRNKIVSPSETVFHTLLDMSRIRTKYLMADKSIASEHFSPTEMVYLNDHNQDKPYGDIGLKKEDFEQLRKQLGAVLK